MLFGDADIVIALGKFFCELHQARTFAHRRGDADQALVLSGHVTQPVTEDLRVRRLAARLGDNPGRGIELARPVIQHRVCLGQLVALPFLRHHVKKLGPLQFFQIDQGRDQGFQIVTIDRADVIETELFKHGARHHHAFGVLFEALGQLPQGRCHAQNALAGAARGGVEAPRHQARKVAIQRAHRWGYRHVVVVEYDDQARILADTGVIQCFKGLAGRHRAVADHGHRVPVLALLPGGHRHPERSRDRR